ncbi:MAG: hypothetical protein IJV70_05245, partial [Clostridia bacterium]|nr:hypothetical protein [Clostridia bacterium]
PAEIVRAPYLTPRSHFLPILQKILQLHRASRKCEACASIFVEMIAQTSFSTCESEPLKIYHGLSFFFLRAFFFFLLRKKEEKREIYIKRII